MLIRPIVLSRDLFVNTPSREEFEFRFNNRNNPYLSRDTLLRLIASDNLKYKELTKDAA